jgi:hypothetical protein
MMFHRREWTAQIGLAGLLVALSGCGSEKQSEEREQSNLKPLAVLYGQFTAQHRGQAPSNEDEFKKFIQALPPEKLASFKVANVDILLVSARDQKPYVVVYGPAPSAGSSPTNRVIAYEQTGVGGKRFVAFSVGKIEEVDQARFKELVPGAP